MLNRVTAVLLLSLTLITSGCGASPMKTPDIKQNPNPKMRYEITITIDGAPGPFDSITSEAEFQVMNPTCVPMRPGSGATPTISKSLPIVLKRESNNVYKGTFNTDSMKDEDYFGLGVCHWELIAADVELVNKKVSMSAFLSLHDVTSQKPVSRYFSNASYHNIDMDGTDTGNAERSDFGPKANETFSVTLEAKELVQ